MKRIITIILIGGLCLASQALATGIYTMFNDGAIKDLADSSLSDANYHNYQVRLEFFHGSLPNPTTSTGRLADASVTPYYTHSGGVHKYSLSSLNGGTLNVRVWKDVPSGDRQGNYYGKTSHGVASGTTLPYDWTITNLKTDYKADVPYKPTIGSISESMVRTGDTLKLKLAIPISYNENGPDGKRETTGFSLEITYPDNTVVVENGSSITLNDTPAGTYKFKPTATNWYGSTVGDEVTYATLGGASANEEISLALTKQTDGFGINSFGIPFAVVYDSEGTQLSNIKDLVVAINAAGDGYVATIGFWDGQKEVGFTFNEAGEALDKINTDQNPEEISLVRVKGYQVSVTADKTVILRNY